MSSTSLNLSSSLSSNKLNNRSEKVSPISIPIVCSPKVLNHRLLNKAKETTFINRSQHP